MRTQAKRTNWTAICVVGRVGNQLQICRQCDPLINLPAIEALQDLLRAVAQGAVAQKKAEPAGSQVVSVARRDLISHDRQTNSIFRPLPAMAVNDHAD